MIFSISTQTAKQENGVVDIPTICLCSNSLSKRTSQIKRLDRRKIEKKSKINFKRLTFDLVWNEDFYLASRVFHLFLIEALANTTFRCLSYRTKMLELAKKGTMVINPMRRISGRIFNIHSRTFLKEILVKRLQTRRMGDQRRKVLPEKYLKQFHEIN